MIVWLLLQIYTFMDNETLKLLSQLTEILCWINYNELLFFMALTGFHSFYCYFVQEKYPYIYPVTGDMH